MGMVGKTEILKGILFGMIEKKTWAVSLTEMGM